MRPTRAVLLVVATALTPALLLTAPAFASGSAAPVTATVATVSDTPVDEMSEDELRAAIAAILRTRTAAGGSPERPMRPSTAPWMTCAPS